MKKVLSFLLMFAVVFTLVIPVNVFAEGEQTSLIYYVEYQGNENPDETECRITFDHGSNTSSLNNFRGAYSESFDPELGIEMNITATINSEQYTKIETLFVGTTEEIVKLNIIVDETDIGNEIRFVDVQLDTMVEIQHEDQTFRNIGYDYENGEFVFNNVIGEFGNYNVVFWKAINEGDSIVIDAVVETMSIQEETPSSIIVTTTTDQAIELSLLANDLEIAEDGLMINHTYLEDLSGVSKININSGMFYRQVRVSKNDAYFVLELPEFIADLTTVSAIETDIQQFDRDTYLPHLFEFTDGGGHPININYFERSIGTYTVTDNDGTSVTNPISMFIDLGEVTGTANISIDIPELNIQASRDIDIASYGNPIPNVEFYEDYQVTVETPEGLLIEKAIAFYDKYSKEIRLFVPQETEAVVKIIGLENGMAVTAPLDFTLNFDEYEHQFDRAMQTLSLKATTRGYGDLVFGSVDNGPNIKLNVYKGKLGVLDVKDVKGLPHSGEVHYSISYEIVGGNQEGSNSNDFIYEGKLYIPIQDNILSLNYAFVVVSPCVKPEQKEQANTQWINLTSAIIQNENNFYDLGMGQFQPVEFVGKLYLSDQTTPLNNAGVIAIANPLEGDDVTPRAMFFPGVVQSAEGSTNTFYLASLGEKFSPVIQFETIGLGSNQMTINGVVDLSKQQQEDFSLQPEQIKVYMKDPEGKMLIEEYGYDRHIYIKINDEPERNLFSGDLSEISFGGLNHGDKVELTLCLDMGDFDHLRLTNSLKVKFIYDENHNAIQVVDSQEQTVNTTVDENGLLNIDLLARPTQLFGNVYQGDRLVTEGVIAELIDPVTNEIVASDRVHSSSQGEDRNGVINLGSEQDLFGDYILRLSDPSNSVEYYGADYDVTLPHDVTKPMIFNMPASKVYGQLKLDSQDDSASQNNVDRVYVNLFDAAGKFVKNIMVRNDGMFTLGSLTPGKYFVKAFISPISTLFDRYSSSKMTTFEFKSSTEKEIIDLPLAKVMGQGLVTKPNQDISQFSSDVWVKIYNAQGVEVEALKAKENGEFQIPELPVGAYKIKAFAADGYMDSNLVELVKDVNGTYSAILELTEPQVTGTITNESSEMIFGAQVLLFDDQMNLVSSTETDSDGNYAFGGLVSGNYYLQAQPSTSGDYVTTERIPLAYQIGLMTQDLTLESVQLTGSVNNPDGTKAVSGWVHVYADGDYDRSVRIDAGGNFYLSALDADVDYQVFAQDDLGQYGNSIRTAIVADQTVTLQFRDKEIDEYGILKFNSEILSNAKYILYNAEGQALYQSMTNVFGEATLSDLETGEYTLVVPMDNEFYYLKLQLRNDGQAIGDLVLIRGEQ